MRVSLGTYELSDDERRAIKKSLGFRGGKASREEARDFLLAAAADGLSRAAGPAEPDEDGGQQ